MKVKIGIMLLHLFALFPMEVLRLFGRFAGYLCWHMNTKSAEVTSKNLTLCFPELNKNERDKLAKQSLQETLTTVAQIGPVWLWPVEKVITQVDHVEGFEVLEKAYDKGKGVIIIAPHLGNWEFLGLYLDTCGLGQMNTLYQPPKHESLERLIISARSRAGNKLLPTNLRGVAKILSALRKGEMSGILPDQVPEVSGGLLSKFFGVEAFSMTLISRLLQKTEASAVFAYAKRLPKADGQGFKIVFREAPKSIYSEKVALSVQGLNDGVEALVKEVPQQYQWEYKRFKRIDNREIKVY